MKSRRRMGRKQSRKYFSRNAVKVHRKNIGAGRPSRGGIRL